MKLNEIASNSEKQALDAREARLQREQRALHIAQARLRVQQAYEAYQDAQRALTKAINAQL